MNSFCILCIQTVDKNDSLGAQAMLLEDVAIFFTNKQSKMYTTINIIIILRLQLETTIRFDIEYGLKSDV